MKIKDTLKGVALGSAVGGVFNTVVTTVSAGIGAAVMSGSGRDGYDVAEAAQMGAIGGAIIGASAGAVKGGLMAAGFFSPKSDQCCKGGKISTFTSVHLGGAMAAGLIGYGISSPAIMGLAQTGAALAAGAFITLAPVAYGVLCVGLPFALVVKCLNNFDDEPEAEAVRVNTI